MFETVLTQELSLPTSKIRDFEERVPLPKFVAFQHLPFVRPATAEDQQRDEEDSFYHFCFLSQIVHRIILTRARGSIFYSSTALPSVVSNVALISVAATGDYPRAALVEELLHQLEQWRIQLPVKLQFDNSSTLPMPNSSANILVVPWLRSRYIIAKYHLARPLLYVQVPVHYPPLSLTFFRYKALNHPQFLTTSELERCEEALHHILEWQPIMQQIKIMKSCMPLKFLLCSQ